MIVRSLEGSMYLKTIAVIFEKTPYDHTYWVVCRLGRSGRSESSDLSRFARVRTWAFLVNVQLKIIFAMKGLSQHI